MVAVRYTVARGTSRTQRKKQTTHTVKCTTEKPNLSVHPSPKKTQKNDRGWLDRNNAHICCGKPARKRNSCAKGYKCVSLPSVRFCLEGRRCAAIESKQVKNDIELAISTSMNNFSRKGTCTRTRVCSCSAAYSTYFLFCCWRMTVCAILQVNCEKRKLACVCVKTTKTKKRRTASDRKTRRMRRPSLTTGVFCASTALSNNATLVLTMPLRNRHR